MKKRKVVNFHWTETTSFSSVIRPRPFAQNPYKDFQFPFSQERISCFYSEFLGFTLKILKKEERILSEWAPRWFHYRFIRHTHTAILSVRAPWPFRRQFQHPSLLFLSPALRSLWCDKGETTSPSPRYWPTQPGGAPAPEVPGRPGYHFLPQTGSPLGRFSPEPRCSEWRRSSELLNDDRGGELKIKKRKEERKKEIKCQQQPQNTRWSGCGRKWFLENGRKINRVRTWFHCQEHSGVIWGSYLCSVSRTILEKKWLNTGSVSRRRLIVALGSPLGGFDKGNMSW